jgi:hypothetical protein
MDYWYEGECEELAHAIEHPIHVRVDPMIHPEKARIEVVAGFKDEKGHIVRVGDEHDVELLPGRLPNATSAAAVVDSHLVEVENAANNAGNFARIRILDVDDKDDYVLAELVTAGAKPRRKRRGGRRVEVSAAEQTRQLRELAEDAARQSAARPPIGISPVSEEEEAQDKALSAERRGEAQPDAIIIAQGAVQHATGDGRRKRRRRRRGRGRDEAATVAEPTVVQASVASEVTISPDGAGQQRRRRRRRRGRRGRGGAGGAMPAAMPDRHIFEVSSDGAAHPTGETAPPEPSRAISTVTQTKAAPPAVEAPPPSLSAPEEELKRTKPARRRRTPRAAAAGELKATASALALPAAAPKTRRPRKKAEPVSDATEPVATIVKAEKTKPKPARKRKTPATSRKKKS